MDNLFPMDHEATPEPASLSGRFGTAQLEDPNLTSALQQVTVVDGKAIEGRLIEEDFTSHPEPRTIVNDEHSKQPKSGA
ncbi:unnamed protein product [Gadus morhua 'NCC']